MPIHLLIDKYKSYQVFHNFCPALAGPSQVRVTECANPENIVAIYTRTRFRLFNLQQQDENGCQVHQIGNQPENVHVSKFIRKFVITRFFKNDPVAVRHASGFYCFGSKIIHVNNELVNFRHVSSIVRFSALKISNCISNFRKIRNKGR